MGVGRKIFANCLGLGDMNFVLPQYFFEKAKHLAGYSGIIFDIP